jgi:hypothetical protein
MKPEIESAINMLNRGRISYEEDPCENRKEMNFCLGNIVLFLMGSANPEEWEVFLSYLGDWRKDMMSEIEKSQ